MLGFKRKTQFKAIEREESLFQILSDMSKQDILQKFCISFVLRVNVEYNP
jgi:hypothetical protein